MTVGAPAAGETVPRLLVAWFPHWPVVTALGGRVDDVPAAVLRSGRVLAASRRARQEGVRPGQRRREAQARCPRLELLADDPERDARRFEPVVRAVGGLVPLLEAGEPGTLSFATRGPSRYAGGDEALAERVAALCRDALPGSGHRLGVGIAAGRFAAMVAARRSAATGRAVVIEPGEAASARFLAGFPLRTLHDPGGLPAGFVELLGRLGLRRLGELAGFGTADLLARFGELGVLAHRFAGAADDRPLGAAPPPAELAVARHLDDPLAQLDTLVFIARQAANELHATLAGGGIVVTRLLVEAETEHGERSERAWYRSEGLGASAIVERVRWQLDGWARRPGGLTGGVTVLRLSALEVRPDDGRQHGLWGGQSEADEWAARAAARVAGLLGDGAVVVPEWSGGRGPGQHRLVPVGSSDLDPAARRRALGAPVPTRPWPGRLPVPSPAWVLPEPQPCEVLDDEDRPVRVSGRGVLSASPTVVVAGRDRRRVVAWAGPWPVEERWWDPQRSSRRARFQLVDERGDALLVELSGGRWQLTARYA